MHLVAIQGLYVHKPEDLLNVHRTVAVPILLDIWQLYIVKHLNQMTLKTVKTTSVILDKA